jgi:hypothetical protein
MKQYHRLLFLNVPVIFCGVNNIQSALSVDRNYYTGLVETLDIPANIALILPLLSHLQNCLFAQTLRYAQNFIIGISIICLW